MTTAITRTRRRSTPFEARFVERHPDFAPIRRAASAFFSCTDWPAVADYGQAFAGEPPVSFLETPPKPRRARARTALDRSALYDARIVAGVVPTRPRCWHDFSNALVWATFPRAKQSLHARQHRAIEAWIPAGATRLPGARSREMDALALLDEGGVVQVGDTPVVFGHALYEGAALLFAEDGAEALGASGPRRVVAREVLRLPAVADEPLEARVQRVEAALVALLESPEPLRPESFPQACSLFSGNSASEG